MSLRLLPVRVLLALAAVVLLGLQLLSAPTLSGWTSGQVANTTNTVATGTGTYKFTHTYSNPSSKTCGSTTTSAAYACPDSILPYSVPASGSSTQNDSIYNYSGVGGLSSTLSIPRCGPVELANQRNSDNNPMLPRFNTWTYRVAGPWAGTTAVTLDGTTAYATSARSRPWTKPASSTSGYAVGAWFKSTTAKNQPIIALSTAAVGAPDQSDILALVLSEFGTVNGIYDSGGTSAQSANANYRNGAWHFAYMVVTSSSVSVSVDGTVGTVNSPGTFPATSATARYWRLGRANAYATGAFGHEYFTGSLSNAVVFTGSALPAHPTAAQLASQSAFDTWAAPATEYWRLNDPGTTNYTGTRPDWLNTLPCDQVNLAWSASTPTGSAPARTLAAWATPATIPAPGHALIQSSNLSLSRISGFDADAVGLMLNPSVLMTHGAAGSWQESFTWSTSGQSARILVQ